MAQHTIGFSRIGIHEPAQYVEQVRTKIAYRPTAAALLILAPLRRCTGIRMINLHACFERLAITTSCNRSGEFAQLRMGTVIKPDAQHTTTVLCGAGHGFAIGHRHRHGFFA